MTLDIVRRDCEGIVPVVVADGNDGGIDSSPGGGSRQIPKPIPTPPAPVWTASIKPSRPQTVMRVAFDNPSSPLGWCSYGRFAIRNHAQLRLMS